LKNQELIQSGVLESYVLGIASQEEQDYIAQMIDRNTELEAYVVSLEATIKEYFANGSITPPSEVRDVLTLRDADVKKTKHTYSQAKQEPAKVNYLDVEVNETHIKVHKYWRPAFIAVFILSKIFLIAGLYFYFKTVNLEQKIEKNKTEVKP
jgi:anti-sigma-K factor RskA